MFNRVPDIIGFNLGINAIAIADARGGFTEVIISGIYPSSVNNIVSAISTTADNCVIVGAFEMADGSVVQRCPILAGTLPCFCSEQTTTATTTATTTTLTSTITTSYSETITSTQTTTLTSSMTKTPITTVTSTATTTFKLTFSTTESTTTYQMAWEYSGERRAIISLESDMITFIQSARDAAVTTIPSVTVDEAIFIECSSRFKNLTVVGVNITAGSVLIDVFFQHGTSAFEVESAVSVAPRGPFWPNLGNISVLSIVDPLGPSSPPLNMKPTSPEESIELIVAAVVVTIVVVGLIFALLKNKRINAKQLLMNERTFHAEAPFTLGFPSTNGSHFYPSGPDDIQLDEFPDPDPEIWETEPERCNEAARTIQAGFRGGMARKERREQIEAAVKIQAQYRGYKTRQITAEIMAEKVRKAAPSILAYNVEAFEPSVLESQPYPGPDDVGRRVTVNGYPCKGTVAFVGIHRGSIAVSTDPSGSQRFGTGVRIGSLRGLRCGIILDEKLGKNNGTVDGESYFSCDEGFGILVNPSKVTLLAPDEPSFEERQKEVKAKAQRDADAERWGMHPVTVSLPSGPLKINLLESEHDRDKGLSTSKGMWLKAKKKVVTSLTVKIAASKQIAGRLGVEGKIPMIPGVTDNIDRHEKLPNAGVGLFKKALPTNVDGKNVGGKEENNPRVRSKLYAALNPEPLFYVSERFKSEGGRGGLLPTQGDEEDLSSNQVPGNFMSKGITDKSANDTFPEKFTCDINDAELENIDIGLFEQDITFLKAKRAERAAEEEARQVELSKQHTRELKRERNQIEIDRKRIQKAADLKAAAQVETDKIMMEASASRMSKEHEALARKTLGGFTFRTDEQRLNMAAEILQAWFRGVKTRRQLAGIPFGEVKGNPLFRNAASNGDDMDYAGTDMGEVVIDEENDQDRSARVAAARIARDENNRLGALALVTQSDTKSDAKISSDGKNLWLKAGKKVISSLAVKVGVSKQIAGRLGVEGKIPVIPGVTDNIDRQEKLPNTGIGLFKKAVTGENRSKLFAALNPQPLFYISEREKHDGPLLRTGLEMIDDTCESENDEPTNSEVDGTVTDTRSIDDDEDAFIMPELPEGLAQRRAIRAAEARERQDAMRVAYKKKNFKEMTQLQIDRARIAKIEGGRKSLANIVAQKILAESKRRSEKELTTEIFGNFGFALPAPDPEAEWKKANAWKSPEEWNALKREALAAGDSEKLFKLSTAEMAQPELPEAFRPHYYADVAPDKSPSQSGASPIVPEPTARALARKRASIKK